MPEIKNQFTGGKMNKDLDERLVPKGEYRDAMNIQVSTSEGSDVGTVQNILGNKELGWNSGMLPNNARCVGAVADEKNDALYWFVTSASPYSTAAGSGMALDTASFTSSSPQGLWANGKSMILQLKNGGVTPVFVAKTAAAAYTIYQVGGNIAWDSAASTITFPSNLSVTDLEVGMTLQGDSSILMQSYIGMVVDSINIATNTIVINGDITWLDLVTSQQASHQTKLFFVSLGLANNRDVLGFNSDNLITGINILDDMLFWTDGETEPKKINIPRSIEGTDDLGMSNTRLINEAQGINYASNILIEEEHITVIKKAPSMPPTLKPLTSIRENGVNAVGMGINFSTSTGSNPQLIAEGSTMYSLTITSNVSGMPPNILVGDVLLFHETAVNLYPPENYQVRASVVQINSTSGSDMSIDIELISVAQNTPLSPADFNVAVSEEGYNLFERKFPRFAVRYKWEDGEYSTISPFSEVVFLPGHFSYHPTEAYNRGMVNNLKSLELKDFIPSDLPKDVVLVDLLYKDEKSPEIYVVKSISPLDDAWLAEGSYAGARGSYKITTENIFAVIASDQGLRLWDSVPRTAKAQEVTGNRVVYGNYLQGHDIDTVLSIAASLTIRGGNDGFVGGRKSIKSSRTYNVGIVYGDKYGRETPVFTDKNSNQIVAKERAVESNSLEVAVTSSHPSWARYYKFFVKETSNEYYNLALGRVYDAADGNIWLSFPSVDRNKVDEDTYLILKKGFNTTTIREEARYKIVAIENEAPDYIKTTLTQLARPNKYPNVSTSDVFGGLGGSPKEPSVGAMSFFIDSELWMGDVQNSDKFGQPNLKDQWTNRDSAELYVSIIGDVGEVAVSSKKYLITEVTEIAANSATGTSVAVFEVFISSPILEVDDWISNTISLSGTPISMDDTRHRPVIYKEEVLEKPEFDGRFFVKIKDDAISRNHLAESFQQDINWQTIASADIFWLRDGASKDSIDDVDYAVPNTQDLVGAVGNTTGNSRSGKGQYGKADFETLVDPNNDGVGRWFIDQVAYAGTQSSATGYYDEAYTTYSMSDLDSYQCYTTPNTNPWWQSNNSTGTCGNYGTGFSEGTVFGAGIKRTSASTNYANSKKHELTLSYSGISPSSDYNWGMQTFHWGVGVVGSGEPQEQQFVDQIKIGSKFRMSGDPAKTYTISNVTKLRVYNYRAFMPEPYYPGNYYEHGNGAWHRAQWAYDMGHQTNKRLQFTIEYTIDGGDLANDLRDNVGIASITATSSGELQFITPFESGEQAPISIYPAIFETEPKEDLDLDIYYEASGKIPTSLNNGDGALLIPPGSILRIDPALSIDFPTGITASNWGANDVLNILPHINLAKYALLQPLNAINATLIFDTPTGDVAYVELVDANLDTNAALNPVTGFVINLTGKSGLGWFNCWSFGNGVESNRLGDTFNKPYLSNGAKVSTTLDKEYKQETRKYGLIYSGIYNSTSGVNNLNQFISAEKITKDINPIYGSIQKLYAGWGQGGDLIALCEDRVLKILANKDALYNADGNTNVTSTNNVLGQAIPYSGEYGISKNPESLASEAYRIYFTDKVRGTVMRLSMDGLTPISNHGMKDWFRDNLKLNSTILGSYDDKKDEYNVTLQQTDDAKRNNNPVTVTFREDVKGWVSFKSFTPENAISCANEYYTFKDGDIWKHHDESVGRNTFYGAHTFSTFNVVLNDVPSSVKSFNTINYEGSQSKVDQLLTDGEYHNLHTKTGWYVDSISTNKETGTINEFIEKEGKWFNYIKGQKIQHGGQHILINPDGSSTFDQASLAIQGIGLLSIPPITTLVYGCTDISASNYESWAQIDDGSCIPFTYGCMEPTASNYNSTISTDDGTCTWLGCTVNDGSQVNPTLFPAIAYSYSASNSIFDDGSCMPIVYGCTDPYALNYMPSANTNATSSTDATSPCIPYIYGCMILLSDNYNPLANTDDGTCTWLGCTEPLATNYGWFGSWPGYGFPPGSNSYAIAGSQYGIQNNAAACLGGGCMDPTATNYDLTATYDPQNPAAPDYTSTEGSCFTCDWTAGGGSYGGVPIVNVFVADETSSGAGNGQLSVEYDTYGPYLPYTFSIEDNSGNVYTVYNNNQSLGGFSNANHVLFTNLPTGTYDVTIHGNGIGAACVYMSTAHVISTGVAPVYGCMSPNACNYDASADTDNGSCDFTSCGGCTDILADAYPFSQGLQTGTNNACITPNTFAPGPCTISCGDSLGLPFGNYCCSYTVYGCTDPTACNYTPAPTTGGSNGMGGNVTIVDDGSCSYSGCMDASLGMFPNILGLDINGNACGFPCQDVNGDDIGYSANNYTPCATVEPVGICDYGTLGCTDATACNYDPNAQVDDSSCVFGFIGATIGDPNAGVTIPVWYYDPPQNNNITIQHFVSNGYSVGSVYENDIGLTIQSVQQTLSQYTPNVDIVTVNLWRKEQFSPFNWILQHTHDITINQVYWQFGATAADGAVFGGNRTSPGNNPYPWGPSAQSSSNFHFQPLHLSIVEYAVEITSTIASVTYGESTVTNPTAQTEACGVWKPFTFNPLPNCANPYAVLGCTDATACNFDQLNPATCDDGSCYYGTGSPFYQPILPCGSGCSECGTCNGPACDPATTNYTSMSGCMAACGPS